MSERKKDLSGELSAPGPLADKVKSGYPGDPTGGYTETDKKRSDERGLQVVDGEPWSTQSTGMYLAIYGSLSRAKLAAYGAATGTELKTKYGVPLFLSISVSQGRPTPNQAGCGAALELPADLATDESKKDYVSQWVQHTTAEILEHFAGRVPCPHAFAGWLISACDMVMKRRSL